MGVERRNEYDEVNYPGRSIVFTHPDRMAALAALMGLSPANPARCRVLELGCGDGMNLLPMAELLPGSAFVGLDYTAGHIAAARATAAAMGLTNVTFAQRDIRDVTAADGEFDYVIAHGVYSWAPPEVRDALLRVCRANLAAHGVAYVSYNTLPGWYFRMHVRDLMRLRTEGIADPVERVRVAHEFAAFAARALPAEGSAAGFLLNEYVRSLDERGPVGSAERVAFSLHDELNEINDPVYFMDFVKHAAGHGLRYLSEADLQSSLPSRFPEWVAEELQRVARTVEELEQYGDMLRNRMFRRTLLCRAEREVRRDLGLKLDTLRGFCFRAEARPPEDADLAGEGAVEFRGPEGAAITLSHPVSKAGLGYLHEQFPRAVPFAELVGAAMARAGTAPAPQTVGPLISDLMAAFTYSGRLVSLHMAEMPCVVVAGERPRATALVRRQAAARAPFVTNVAHMQVELDPVSQFVLPLLDGTRTRLEVVDALEPLVRRGELTLNAAGAEDGDDGEGGMRAALGRQLEAALDDWAYRGLLLQ